MIGRTYKDVIKKIVNQYTKIQRRQTKIYTENRGELRCCQSISSSFSTCGILQFIQANDKNPVNVVNEIRGTRTEYDRTNRY